MCHTRQGVCVLRRAHLAGSVYAAMSGPRDAKAPTMACAACAISRANVQSSNGLTCTLASDPIDPAPDTRTAAELP